MSGLDVTGKTPDECQVLAKIAEVAERYDDMCTAMRSLVEQRLKEEEASKSGKAILEVEQRNLLSVAYKNVVGAKRSAWRTLAMQTKDPEPTSSAADQAVAKEYKKELETELKATCDEVIGLLKQLCDHTEQLNDETTVFYYKMKGDYHRYLSEFMTDDKGCKDSCEKAYKKAMTVAESALNETHPTRLGLALNFSVCYYEILKQPDEACKLAKKAFDAAIEKLDTLNDSSYKDSTLIMQLLRDNLTLWTSEKEADGDAK